MSDELTGKKILLVDDDRDILAAMEMALGDLGVEIEQATDGNQAVDLASRHEPDLVVLDMMLPKRSGFLVMEKLKRTEAEKRPKVIMITGNLGTRHRAYAETLGVDVYLNKPFRMEKLVGAVRELLG
jgi:DNA-binding response OmpR family regulator